MAVSMGIKVQPSRFAALQVDSGPDSGGEEGGKEEWKKVPKGGGKGKGMKHGPASGGGGGDGAMSKSAKKRARKKKNHLSASSEPVDDGAAVVSTGGGVEGRKEEKEDVGLQQWQERNKEATDVDFQKELEEAMLLSTLEAEHQTELDKERKAAEALLAKAKAKKGVTLSLQELHRGPVFSPPPAKVTESPKEPLMDPHFFERVGEGAQGAMRNEHTHSRRKNSERQTSPPAADETARVAQLKDELEKRDRAISTLTKENEALQRSLKEVKGRNQSLCKIMSQGEFSTTAQLLQQIDELTTVKNDITEEMATLHSSLEQEKSKNKLLKAEVTKLQGVVSKGSSKH